jgi:hypothetical protein
MKYELMQAFIDDHLKRSRVELIKASDITDELKDIATKRGIDLANCDRDFAFFKNVYALTDIPNGNKCILPEDKIVPVLSSIILKPININHMRTYTVGVYLDAKIESGTIYAYGIFFKANFQDEWEEAQQLFSEGKLTTSFEIWCPKDNRTLFEDGTFSLDAPVIAGGAILFNCKPACKEAKVLELALERAKTSTVPEYMNDLVAASQVPSDEIVTSEYCEFDMNEILRLVNTIVCPECGATYMWKVNSIDFNEQEVYAECLNCGLGIECELKPSVEISAIQQISTVSEGSVLTYKEREALSDSDFALVIKKEEGKKIRMFPCIDEAHCKNALSRLGQDKIQDNLKKMGADIKFVLNNILKKAKKLGLTELVNHNKANEEETKMEEKIKELEAEIAKLKQELETATASIKEKDVQIQSLEEAKKQLSEAAQEELKKVEAQIEQAKKDAKIVAERRLELGESAKEMKDEDLLNEDKYQLAKLTKEKADLVSKVAELEKKIVPNTQQETASTKGASDDADAATKAISAARQRITSLAFPKKSK